MKNIDTTKYLIQIEFVKHQIILRPLKFVKNSLHWTSTQTSLLFLSPEYILINFVRFSASLRRVVYLNCKRP